MKKTVLLVVFATMALSLCALAGFGPRQFGIMGGVNVSTLSGDDVSNVDPKAGFAVGFYGIMGLGPTMDLEVDLLYSNKTSESEETIAGVKVSEEFDTAYLEIPVLAKMKLPLPGPITPNVFAGPAFSFLISDDYSRKAEGTSINDLIDYNSFDWGIVVGVGAEISNVHVDARYNFGLSDAIDYKNIDGDTNAQNSTFSLMLGWSFF